MPIRKTDLEKMNDLLSKGTKISELAKKFPKYDYWEIYWEVNDYSFLGKKRTITNRINKMSNSRSPKERKQLASQVNKLITELYNRLKENSEKLIEIDRVLRK